MYGRPCILDKERNLETNIVYFSFLMPLQQGVVLDFVIGCASGRSLFVALEHRCHCLIWASLPSPTKSPLAGYTLFEVLIDTNRGGTFLGCQNVIDLLFRSVRHSSKVTLNRLPYVTNKCSKTKSKKAFISSVKNIFKTNSFCDLMKNNKDTFDKIRTSEQKEHREIMGKDLNIIKAKQIMGFRELGPRCLHEGWLDKNNIKSIKLIHSYNKKSKIKSVETDLMSNKITLLKNKIDLIEIPQIQIEQIHISDYTQSLSKDKESIKENMDRLKTKENYRSEDEISKIDIIHCLDVTSKQELTEQNIKSIKKIENKVKSEKDKENNEIKIHSETERVVIESLSLEKSSKDISNKSEQKYYEQSTEFTTDINSIKEINEKLNKMENDSVTLIDKNIVATANVKEKFTEEIINFDEKPRKLSDINEILETFSHKLSITDDEENKKILYINERFEMENKENDLKNISLKKDKLYNEKELLFNRYKKEDQEKKMLDPEEIYVDHFQEVSVESNLCQLDCIEINSGTYITSKKLEHNEDIISAFDLNINDKITKYNELTTENVEVGPIMAGTYITSKNLEHNEDIISAFDLNIKDKLRIYNEDELTTENVEEGPIEGIQSSFLQKDILLSSPEATENEIKDKNALIKTDKENEKKYMYDVTKKSSSESLADILSSISIICTTTSNTERLISPQLISKMEELEVRDQAWTPVPLSDCEQEYNANMSHFSIELDTELLFIDWEIRLSSTIKKYLFENIF